MIDKEIKTLFRDIQKHFFNKIITSDYTFHEEFIYYFNNNIVLKELVSRYKTKITYKSDNFEEVCKEILEKFIYEYSKKYSDEETITKFDICKTKLALIRLRN